MEAKTQFKDKNELVKALSELKEEPIFIGTSHHYTATRSIN